MGVKDLWKLLESTGRPVSLESLQGLVLSVDVSVWLHQAVHGARDREGQPLQSAHLALLFSRICKLLYYQIRPVFVFDGGTPALKQQTLARRSQRRQSAAKRSQKAEEKQMTKFLQAKILEQLTGEKSSTAAPRLSGQPDLFDLPPLNEQDALDKERSPVLETSDSSYLHDVASVDIHSAAFASLPPEVQHEMLQERQQLERHSYTDPALLPAVADDFSNYQLSKLMTRSKLSRKLEDVRRVLKSSETVAIDLGGEGRACEVEANRIASSDSAHYILVRGVDLEEERGEEVRGVGSSSQGEGGEEGEGRQNSVSLSAVTTQKPVSASVPAAAISRGSAKSFEDDVIVVADDVIHVADDVVTMSGSESSESGIDMEDVELERDTEFKVQPVENRMRSELLKAVVVKPVQPPPSSAGGVLTVSEDGAGSCEPEKQQQQQQKQQQQQQQQSEAGDGRTTAITADSAMTEPSALPTGTAMSTDIDSRQLVAMKLHSPETQKAPVEDDLPSGSGVQPVQACEREAGEGEAGEGEAGEGEAGEGEAGVGWEEGLLQLSPEAAQSRLRQEAGELDKERGRQSRAAASVSSLVYREAQELLSLFGLPYIISPMEAEAQCAYLDHTHQTSGTVTDDSDVFLFGGQKVYRHFFNHEREVTAYSTEDISQTLGLSRSSLVCLAYLLGSDYTPGLEGVGVVNAMEVVGRFQGEGMEPLRKLKEWHATISSAPGLTLKTSFERKLRDLQLPPDFPSDEVWQAYLGPEVDESREELQWGMPDLDLIRKYMTGHVGWSQTRVDSDLLPVLKRINSRQPQRTITSYLTASSPHLPAPIRSSRLRNVVARIRGGHGSTHSSANAGSAPPSSKRLKKDREGEEESGEGSSSDETFSEESSRRGRRGRGKRGRGRGRGKRNDEAAEVDTKRATGRGRKGGRGRGRGKGNDEAAEVDTKRATGRGRKGGRGRGRGKGKGRKEPSPDFSRMAVVGGSKLSASSSSSESDEFDSVVKGLNEDDFSHMIDT